MAGKKMNVKLLRKVKRHILEEPARFDMAEFVIKGEYVQEWAARLERPVPACGTVACIAGWAVLLTYPLYDGGTFAMEKEATTLLGLEGLQVGRLFFAGEWPEEFRAAYNEAMDTDVRVAAEVAARRIEHFIKTNGAE